MTKMRVFLDSGTVTYDNVDQAREDLQAKGFPVPPRPEGRSREMPRLHFSWEQVGRPRCTGGRGYQQSIRDKLCKFHRGTDTEAEDC